MTTAARLERLQPPGEPLELPDGKATITLGRGRKATIVFDDARLSLVHCELAGDGSLWTVRDLGSANGTRINGVPLAFPRALFDGDLLELGAVRLRFRCEQAPDDAVAFQALASHDDDPLAWQVFADWLLEREDPLGKRVVGAMRGERQNDLPWLGPLRELYVAGALELSWHHGFIRGAQLRPVAGHLAFDWQAQVHTLVGLRVGRLLRSLSVDLPRLETGPTPLDAQLRAAQAYVASVPSLCQHLRALSFGYRVGGVAAGAALSAELLAAAPGLQPGPVFQVATAARLLVVERADGVRLTGCDGGARVLSEVTRARKADRRTLHLESPPGLAFFASDTNPCYFALDAGTWSLMVGKLHGEVKLNGRAVRTAQLLPGDLLDFQGLAKLRFELVP